MPLRVARAAYVAGLAFLGTPILTFGDYSFSDWAGFLAALLTYGFFFARARIPALNRFVGLSGTLFVFGAILTISNSQDLWSNTLDAILLVYALVFWISLPVALRFEWENLRTAFSALCISVLATGLYAVGESILGFTSLAPQHYWGRVSGLTGHPNMLARFCAIVFPYSLCLAITTRGFFYRLVGRTSAVMAPMAIMVSGSMSGALALIIGFVAFFGLSSWRKRTHIATLVVISALMLGAFLLSTGTPATVQRLESFFHSEEGRVTVEERSASYRSAWEYILSNPFLGSGYRSRVETILGETLVHNTLLVAWHDGGVFTLLGVLALLFAAATSLAVAWKDTRAVDMAIYRTYVIACISSFFALLVTMQVSPILFQRNSWFAVALAFAVGYVVRTRRETIQRSIALVPRVPRPVFGYQRVTRGAKDATKKVAKG